MKGKKKKGILEMASVLWMIALWAISGGVCSAAQENRLPPLIQATTPESDYKAMVSLELGVTPLLQEADFDEAFANVLPACVRIQAGNHYASGSIYKMLEKEIVIVSNRHVLEYWNEDGCVTFFDGSVLGGSLIGLSDSSDVGFVRVPAEDLPYESLLFLRNIRLEDQAEEVARGEAFFAIDIASQWNMPVRREGKILSPLIFLEEFQEEMIYAEGRAYPGMSGCGIFDGCGRYLGMLTGGTLEGEIAAVPAKTIGQVYEEIRGSDN